MLPAARQHTDSVIKQWINKDVGGRDCVIFKNAKTWKKKCPAHEPFFQHFLRGKKKKKGLKQSQTLFYPLPFTVSLLLSASSCDPSPLSAPQRWKNSLDSLAAAPSVWNYALKKEVHHCKNTGGRFSTFPASHKQLALHLSHCFLFVQEKQTSGCLHNVFKN